jgi:hypothetical protein
MQIRLSPRGPRELVATLNTQSHRRTHETTYLALLFLKEKQLVVVPLGGETAHTYVAVLTLA